MNVYSLFINSTIEFGRRILFLAIIMLSIKFCVIVYHGRYYQLLKMLSASSDNNIICYSMITDRVYCVYHILIILTL